MLGDGGGQLIKGLLLDGVPYPLFNVYLVYVRARATSRGLYFMPAKRVPLLSLNTLPHSLQRKRCKPFLVPFLTTLDEPQYTQSKPNTE